MQSKDIETANPDNPVHLPLVGTMAAGGPTCKAVTKGTAVRILTGGKIPKGSNAVVSQDFTRPEEGRVTVFNTAEPGRNILEKVPGRIDFKPLKMPSRLESMALAQGMVAVPEGTDALEKGTQVCVQLLHA